MPAEAWVVLIVGVIGIAGSIIVSAGLIMLRLGGLGERFENHSKDLTDVQKAIEGIEKTLEMLAVQKEQILQLQRAMDQNTERTDITFTRVFTALEKLQERR